MHFHFLWIKIFFLSIVNFSWLGPIKLKGLGFVASVLSIKRAASKDVVTSFEDIEVREEYSLGVCLLGGLAIFNDVHGLSRVHELFAFRFKL